MTVLAVFACVFAGAVTATLVYELWVLRKDRDR